MLTMRNATREDLDLILDWAAEEGWNPGKDDATAFFAADSNGFYVADLGGVPIAAISVVNHDPNHAFLGLYLCRPEHRGQGHALALWTYALTHAQNRTVGLDGVPEQQANYARSGFMLTGQTVRYRGLLPETGHTDAIDAPEIKALMGADRRAVGHAREAYSNAWFTATATRQTIQIAHSGDRPAFATFRTCGEGLKIGPLHAASEDEARALLAARPITTPQTPYFIDVPDSSPDLAKLVTSLGFEPVFQTARMYKGTPPESDPPLFYAVTTLELG